MEQVKKQARTAGFLYTLVAITGPLSLIYIPGQLYTTADNLSTADHIRAHHLLLRLGVGSELCYQTLEIFLMLVLYGLFQPVNKPLARQMLVLGLISIPIVFLNVLNEIAALMLTSGLNFLVAIPASQLDALATMFVGLHGLGLQVAAIFWGLWLFPLGLLIRCCGFIPKLLGVSVMIAGTGYVLGAFAALVFPQYSGAVSSLTFILELGEPPIIIWLLIWGARAQSSKIHPATPAG